VVAQPRRVVISRENALGAFDGRAVLHRIARRAEGIEVFAEDRCRPGLQLANELNGGEALRLELDESRVEGGSPRGDQADEQQGDPYGGQNEPPESARLRGTILPERRLVRLGLNLRRKERQQRRQKRVP